MMLWTLENPTESHKRTENWLTLLQTLYGFMKGSFWIYDGSHQLFSCFILKMLFDFLVFLCTQFGQHFWESGCFCVLRQTLHLTLYTFQFTKSVSAWFPVTSHCMQRGLCCDNPPNSSSYKQDDERGDTFPAATTQLQTICRTRLPGSIRLDAMLLPRCVTRHTQWHYKAEMACFVLNLCVLRGVRQEACYVCLDREIRDGTTSRLYWHMLLHKTSFTALRLCLCVCALHSIFEMLPFISLASNWRELNIC